MTSIDPDSLAIDGIAIDLSVMFICKGLIQLVTSSSPAQKTMFVPKSRATGRQWSVRSQCSICHPHS